MPLGIEFVNEEANPVQFWLWRIASALQDASEYEDESANLRDDVETSVIHRLIKADPLTRKSVGKRDGLLDHDAAESASEVSDATRQFEKAKQLADGKDPHDSETIAALKAIYGLVASERDAASHDADDSFDQFEKHPL